MTAHLVTVATGSYAQTPFAYEVGIKYEIIASDGTRASFNDSTDRDFVGYIEEITGIDSPEVRESFELIVEGDGGRHFDFYHGRRPITISGIFNPNIYGASANSNATRLLQATNAMRDDAVLRWQVTGGSPVEIAVRRNAPPRITGNRSKEFLISLVAADPRVYSQAAKVFNAYYLFGGAGGALTNSGSAESFPVVTLTGPIVNPIIGNTTTGKSISLTKTLTAGQSLEIDFLNRTIRTETGANSYSALNYTSSEWWGFMPGSNTVSVLASGAINYGSANASRAIFAWKDAWL